MIDGRLPEAVGGEFIDSNGLGGTAKRKPGPRIVVGYQDFDENETLAYLYAEALRAAAIASRCAAVGGLRKEAVAALRSGRISTVPRLLGLAAGVPRRQDAAPRRPKLHAEPLALSPAQNRNAFVMKGERARALGIGTLSDLARAWSRRLAARPRRTRCRASSGPSREGSLLDLPGAWG